MPDQISTTQDQEAEIEEEDKLFFISGEIRHFAIVPVLGSNYCTCVSTKRATTGRAE